MFFYPGLVSTLWRIIPGPEAGQNGRAGLRAPERADLVLLSGVEPVTIRGKELQDPFSDFTSLDLAGVSGHQELRSLIACVWALFLLFHAKSNLCAVCDRS